MGPFSAVLLMCALVFSGTGAYLLARCACAAADARSRPGAFHARSVAATWARRAEALPLVAGIVSRARARKRAEQLRDALPGAVQALHMALASGSSPSQALSYAARNCAEPLSSELSRAVWGLEAGQTFEEALEGVRARANVAEFSFLAAALEIQHVTGGSLATVLAAVASSLQQASELSEELKTKTTQGRTSARVVALMPVLLAGVLLALSPGYYAAFFETALGVVLFLLACALWALGVVLVRKVLALDVTGEASI